MKFEMNLNPKPFKQIKEGTKTIELRLNDDRRKNLKANDLIEFTNTADSSQKLLCRVIKINIFKNFEELYSRLPLLRCGYTKSNVSEAKASDMNEYYTDEQIVKYGVIGIELEVLQ